MQHRITIGLNQFEKKAQKWNESNSTENAIYITMNGTNELSFGSKTNSTDERKRMRKTDLVNRHCITISKIECNCTTIPWSEEWTALPKILLQKIRKEKRNSFINKMWRELCHSGWIVVICIMEKPVRLNLNLENEHSKIWVNENPYKLFCHFSHFYHLMHLVLV